MLAAATSGTQADAILGSIPRAVHAPQTIDEAVQIMALTARERMRISFVGGGTELDLGSPPSALDAVVRTSGLSRIIEYAPSDMIVVAEAGTTLQALQDLVGRERQRLALDPPLPERATLGGIIAANAFGPRRARFGSVRDLLIGVSIIRADGTLARGGGKVVKNVAGFDIPKLMCGSLGSLAMIASATFRLHPAAESSATALISAITPTQVRELAAGIKAAQLEPTSVVAIADRPNRFEVAIRFEGFEAGVMQQVERLAQLQVEPLAGIERLTPPEAASLWKRHDAARTGGTLRIKVASLPGAIEKTAELASPVLRSLEAGKFIWYATLGLGFITGTPQDPGRSSLALSSMRSGLVAAGGSLVLHAAPPEIRAAIGTWGPPPPAFPIMQRMKDRFDPDRRLSPGRFIGDP